MTWSALYSLATVVLFSIGGGLAVAVIGDSLTQIIRRRSQVDE